MKKYKHILFDMDGTLVDSEGGIIESLHHTLKMLNYGDLDEESIRKFLGPPLAKSFKDNCNMTNLQAEEAVKIFRDYYSEYGVNNVKLYSEIYNTLKTLHQIGISLYVATSKPTDYAIKIAKSLEIDEFFTDIIGSNLDNTRSDKAEIIQYILEKYHLSNASEVLMIGDKSHDIIGAKKSNVDSLAVTYGYGSLEELTSTMPTYIIHDIKNLIGVVGGTNEEN